MRFRKTIKLAPGLKLNLSKSGISTSLGPKGATLNMKPGRKSRFTAGIPGTGLSDSVTFGESSPQRAVDLPADTGPPPPVWVSGLRITWKVIVGVGTVFLVVLGVVAALLTLGGSSKKR